MAGWSIITKKKQNRNYNKHSNEGLREEIIFLNCYFKNTWMNTAKSSQRFTLYAQIFLYEPLPVGINLFEKFFSLKDLNKYDKFL